MKRSASESATPPSSPLLTPKSEPLFSEDEYAPSESPSPTRTSKKRDQHKPKPKKSRSEHSGVSKAQKALESKTDWEAGWTADKKEAIIEVLLNAGLKTVNLTELSQKFNLTKAQLSNALQSGHKNNLRDKAAKGVRQ